MVPSPGSRVSKIMSRKSFSCATATIMNKRDKFAICFLAAEETGFTFQSRETMGWTCSTFHLDAVRQWRRAASRGSAFSLVQNVDMTCAVPGLFPLFHQDQSGANAMNSMCYTDRFGKYKLSIKIGPSLNQKFASGVCSIKI